MIALTELIALNNRPPKRRDNFNRDSSHVQSGRGYVIHSGIHRSTAFVDKQEHADCWHAFGYWKEQGQEAVNGFIESIIGDTTLEDAEAEAFRRSRPDWRVIIQRPKQAFAGGLTLTAERKSGKAVERVSATNYRHLHFRTL